MKTSLLIFASLAIGTAAFAQENPAPPESSAPPLAADAPAPPVTDPAPPPPPSQDDATSSAAPADTANYPACSRTVHDKCMQAQAGRHMARHKRH